MTPWVGVPRTIARMVVFVAAFVRMTSIVSADPVAPTFADPFGLVFINFPINGIILLVMFTLYTILNRTRTPMGWVYYSFLMLMSVLVITLTGATIDAVVFDFDVFDVYLVGLIAIASICALVAHLVLRMDHLWCMLTGAVFFTVNAFAWYALPRNLEDSVIFDNSAIWSLIILLYILTVIVVSYRLFGKGTAMSFERRTRMDKEDREALLAIGKMEGQITMVFFMVVIALFFFTFVG